MNKAVMSLLSAGLAALAACEDLARAIAFIHEHADELEVDTDCYSLWGGSPTASGWVPARWPRAGSTGRWSSGKARWDSRVNPLL